MPRDKTGHFYYSWYPTIYDEDTQHLSLAEDGAYRRLIDHYMMTRAPLPCSERALARIVGCGLDEWTPISMNVLVYFKAMEGKYHHTFCDMVIAEDTARIMKAKLNGKKGGRPSTSKDEEITHPVTETNPVGLPNTTKPTNTTQNNSYQNISGRGEGGGFLHANGFEVGGSVKFVPSLETCQRLLDITPGWDQNFLIERYNDYQRERGRAKYPEKAILGWARIFTKGRRPQ